MRSTAVRASHWAGPAALVVAAVGLELAATRRREGSGRLDSVGCAGAATVPDRPESHVCESIGSSRARTAGSVVARWAGRAAIAIAVTVFALLAIGPQTGRYRTLTVLTASMQPTFPAGSVVLSVPIPIEEVSVGDVITYSIPVDDHRVVTHRVVEVLRPGVVRTQGDANNTVDPWVAELKGQTAWKAQARVPGLGYALEALSGEAARMASVLALTGVGLFMGLRAIWRRPVLA